MSCARAMRSVLIAAAATVAAGALWAQSPRRPARRVSPLNTPATQTQSVNETRNDTSRINAARRERSAHYHRDDGTILYVDTVTGEEWIDSTGLIKVPPMQFPLFMNASVGIDVWSPVMRAIGQRQGVIGFTADVNLHNRYFPTFEFGLGQSSSTPGDQNYNYRTSLSPYFKIGADYNFLYNSNPDYKWLVGVRYGLSPFGWSVTDIQPQPGYWGPTAPFDIASQRSVAGWFEFSLGLRVKLTDNISAGWRMIYHSILHQSGTAHGQPAYIPGYGRTASAPLTGAFIFSYTLPFKPKVQATTPADTLPEAK